MSLSAQPDRRAPDSPGSSNVVVRGRPWEVIVFEILKTIGAAKKNSDEADSTAGSAGAVTGAVAGSVVGAAIGSVIGPAGTVIGWKIGAVAGAYMGKEAGDTATKEVKRAAAPRPKARTGEPSVACAKCGAEVPQARTMFTGDGAVCEPCFY